MMHHHQSNTLCFPEENQSPTIPPNEWNGSWSFLIWFTGNFWIKSQNFARIYLCTANYVIKIWIDDKRQICLDLHTNIHVNRFFLFAMCTIPAFVYRLLCYLTLTQKEKQSVCVNVFVSMPHKWTTNKISLNFIYSFFVCFFKM